MCYWMEYNKEDKEKRLKLALEKKEIWKRAASMMEWSDRYIEEEEEKIRLKRRQHAEERQQKGKEDYLTMDWEWLEPDGNNERVQPKENYMETAS